MTIYSYVDTETEIYIICCTVACNLSITEPETNFPQYIAYILYDFLVLLQKCIIYSFR